MDRKQTPPSIEARARGGSNTIRRYGADYVASRARAGALAQALEAEGLDPAKMKPEDLAAFERQLVRRSAEHARAAKALKRSLRLTEAEADAEAARNGGAS